MNNAPTTLLFDLDGTLTDPYVGITRSYAHARERLGLSALSDTKLRDLIGPPMDETFWALSDGRPELIDGAIAAYRERYSRVGLFENVVYPGIPAALQTLAASYQLFVCTSKPTTFATRILEHFELANFFERIYGIELNGTRSDKRDLMKWMLERENVACADAAMIGDRKFDVIAAHVCGVMPFGVLWGHGTERELLDAGAVACIASPEDLPTYFATHAPPRT
ncbi:MAG: HAD hydrolase-like protein [Vulcanimicrobiaceae bacterium]